MSTEIQLEVTPYGIKNVENDEDNQKTAAPPKENVGSKFTSCRWRLGYMSLMSFLLLFSYRHSFSFAIVCMERRVVTVSNVTTTDNETGMQTVTNFTNTEVINPYIPAELKGLVLSCYFYGYLLTPLIGGFLAAKFGPKALIGLAMTVSVVIMVFLPIGIRTNVYIIVALRFVMGFFSAEDVLYAACENRISVAENDTFGVRNEDNAFDLEIGTNAILPVILSTFSNISIGGINVASIVSTVVSGFLCQIPVDDGWPLTFYVYGGVGALWLLLWMLTVHDTPDRHPSCSEEEKLRIYYGKTSTTTSVKVLPWKKSLRNPPFWALVTNHIAYSWITNTLQTFLPMYMSDVLKFEITENGILSSLPSVGRLLGGLVFSFLADKLISSTSMSVTTNRKLFQSLGTVLPGAFLIGLSFFNSDQRVLAVVFMILAMTMQAFTMASFRVNHLDIAPRFAGQVMGFTLTCGCCSAIVSPLVTSAITIDRTREQWQQVFILTACIVIAADIFFVIFASGREQEWAKAVQENSDKTLSADDEVMSGNFQTTERMDHFLAAEAGDIYVDADVSKNQSDPSADDTSPDEIQAKVDKEHHGCHDGLTVSEDKRSTRLQTQSQRGFQRCPADDKPRENLPSNAVFISGAMSGKGNEAVNSDDSRFLTVDVNLASVKHEDKGCRITSKDVDKTNVAAANMYTREHEKPFTESQNSVKSSIETSDKDRSFQSKSTQNCNVHMHALLPDKRRYESTTAATDVSVKYVTKL